MSFTCSKTINNDNYYYFNGKRISENEAIDVADDINEGKLPKCYTPSPSRKLNLVKKKLKERTSALQECKVIEAKYNKLMELMNSSIEDIHILKRICVLETQYKERNIKIMNNDNYIKELEKNSDEIDELKTKLVNLEEENSALQET